MAIPTYAGIGLQHIASRFFFLKEEKDRREPMAKRGDRTARPAMSRWQCAATEPQGQP